jgi:hypothetical protein
MLPRHQSPPKILRQHRIATCRVGRTSSNIEHSLISRSADSVSSVRGERLAMRTIDRSRALGRHLTTPRGSGSIVLGRQSARQGLDSLFDQRPVERTIALVTRQTVDASLLVAAVRVTAQRANPPSHATAPR